MKNQLFLLAALSVGVMSCTDADLDSAQQNGSTAPPEETTVSPLNVCNIAVINSSQGRVNIKPLSRAEAPGSLELYAEIENPSAEITGFVKEGRDMSASCVYYDQSSDTYYVTYHMQGNNYNTDQKVETKGFIESFKLKRNAAEQGNPYTVDLQNIYTSNEDNLDFDFNHLYFDIIPNPEKMDYVGMYDVDDFSGTRIIVAGHSSKPNSGKGYDTKAIIGRLNLEDNLIEYRTVLTGDKLTDDNITNKDGSLTSLGDEDAGDVNCVVRKYNNYYLATRKGVAVLSAARDKMFSPIADVNGHNYFLRTPGSAKYLSQPTTTSYVDVLFLNNDTPEEGLTQSTSSSATIARFALSYSQSYCPQGHFDAKEFSWDNLIFPNEIRLDGSKLKAISPVDGKNVFFSGSYNTQAIYTCMGAEGLYVYNPTYSYNQDEVIKFSDKLEGGSRPVNGLFVEDWDSTNGHHYTDGFIYVANGACLTILNLLTLEKVAEYSAFDSSADKNVASANFIHVARTNDYTNENAPDRIITVAYGQAGVKVFRFVPPTK